MSEAGTSAEAAGGDAARWRVRPVSWAAAGGFAVAWVIVLFNVRERFYLPVGGVNQLFAILLGAGLIADLAWKGSRGGSAVVRVAIEPILLLVSLLPMLWFLFGTWEGLYPNYFLFGNILPYSDAAAWVAGAKQLIVTGELTPISANRPMGICMIATLLDLTGRDYQQALVLLVGMAGLAVYFAAREVRVCGGLAAAVLFTAICTFLMAPWLPLFMTETTGFILGCLGFSWLLRGFRLGRFRMVLIGLGLFVFAMFTRMGAMFAVPLVALYALFFFRGNWRCLWTRGAAIGGACLAAAGLSALLFKVLGPEGSAFQGNMYYVFYGLASGGERWDFVRREHPEILDIASFGEQCRYVKALFLEKFAADRLGFFRTIVRLIGVGAGKFHEVLYPPFPTIRAPPPAIPGVLALLAFGFLIYPACRARTPLGFLLPCAAGVMLSFPFVPDEDGIRTYAATYPVMAALAAAFPGVLGAAVWRWRSRAGAETGEAATGRIEERTAEKNHRPAARAWVEPACAAVVIGAIAVYPVWLSLRAKARTPLPPPVKSADGESWRELVFFLNPRSGFVIAGKDRAGRIIEASARSVVRSPGFGSDVVISRQLEYGEYMCDVSIPREASIYAVFDELPIRSGLAPGYVRAVVRPIYVERRWPEVYRVERFEFLDPRGAAGELP